MEYDIKRIGSHFHIYGDYVTHEPYGTGHINDTFRVLYNQGGMETYYIFQRINHNIFKDPVALMENIQRVTSHQREKLSEADYTDTSRRYLEFHHNRDTGLYVYQDDDGTYWRCYTFVALARTYDIVESPDQAYQAARAFGLFQKQLIDLPGERLHETIPDFHNTPKRFENFKKALAADSCDRAKQAAPEIEFYSSHKNISGILLDLNKKGEIPERITHNDTKLNNVLIDDKTGEGICVIDLDTIMPGLVLYDFGDMIRTSTSPAAEDEVDLMKVTMQMHMFEAIARGYLETAGEFLTPMEKQYLPFSGKLITLEIGLRFLTDYLEGDVYFKTHRENHNLDRCRTQMKLVESIEQQEDKMMNFISGL